MLFAAAPGPHMAESKKVWGLQTATAMEFENVALCQQAYNDILTSVANTDTVTARAWCFPKNIPPHALTTESKGPLPKSIQLPIKR
jgi:hypothetical protein